MNIESMFDKLEGMSDCQSMLDFIIDLRNVINERIELKDKMIDDLINMVKNAKPVGDGYYRSCIHRDSLVEEMVAYTKKVI